MFKPGDLVIFRTKKYDNFGYNRMRAAVIDAVADNNVDDIMYKVHQGSRSWVCPGFEVGPWLGKVGDYYKVQGKFEYSFDLEKPKITKVIFNPPATIVFWSDKTKTVVKCGENDEFDAEKGLAMAVTKKYFGNEGNYYNHIKKWVREHEEKDRETQWWIDKLNEIGEIAKKFCEPEETAVKSEFHWEPRDKSGES